MDTLCSLEARKNEDAWNTFMLVDQQAEEAIDRFGRTGRFQPDLIAYAWTDNSLGWQRLMKGSYEALAEVEP